jgi:hypothetical protein
MYNSNGRQPDLAGPITVPASGPRTGSADDRGMRWQDCRVTEEQILRANMERV